MKQKHKDFLSEAHLYEEQGSPLRFLGLAILIIVGIWVPMANKSDNVSIGAAYLLYALPVFIDAYLMKKKTTVGKVWRIIYIILSTVILALSIVFIYHGKSGAPIQKWVYVVNQIMIILHGVLMLFEMIVQGVIDEQTPQKFEDKQKDDDEKKSVVDQSAAIVEDTLNKV